MKILFVIDSLYTSNNGTSISAQRFAGELLKRGHRVRALCSDTPKDGQTIGGEPDFVCGVLHLPLVQPLCEKHDFRYANIRKPLIREACNWADIVHIYVPFGISVACITYCHKIGKPVTAAFHVQPENITSSLGLGKVRWANEMLYSLFRKIVYNRVEHIHAPSQFIAGQMQQRDYTAKLHVISNGIHKQFIDAGKRKRVQALMGQREQTDDKIRIMMIGRLSKEKRQDVIIDAARLSKYADRIQLVFAGRGPEYEHYLEQSRNLAHAPEFVFLEREALIEKLLQVDLYVHASDMEIEAISCIEAFATGLVPIIADSKESATPQFALDERSLFEAGNPQALAEKIDYWIEHTEERKQMEQRYADQGEKYSLKRSVTLFEQMLYAAIDDTQLQQDRMHTASKQLRAQRRKKATA